MSEAFEINDALDALGNGKWLERKQAAEALGQANHLNEIEKLRAVEALCLALYDCAYYVRAAAAVSLGQLGEERALDDLSIAFADRSYEVRYAAAVSFSTIRTGHVDWMFVAYTAGDKQSSMPKTLIPDRKQRPSVGENPKDS